jgi:hypothetical protein
MLQTLHKTKEQLNIVRSELDKARRRLVEAVPNSTKDSQEERPCNKDECPCRKAEDNLHELRKGLEVYFGLRKSTFSPDSFNHSKLKRKYVTPELSVPTN